MNNNVVDFRVMRRLCHRQWNWQAKLTKREPHSWDPRQRTTWSRLVTSDLNSVMRECFTAEIWSDSSDMYILTWRHGKFLFTVFFPVSVMLLCFLYIDFVDILHVFIRIVINFLYGNAIFSKHMFCIIQQLVLILSFHIPALPGDREALYLCIINELLLVHISY